MSSQYVNLQGLFDGGLLYGTISGYIPQTTGPADRRPLLDQYTGQQQNARAINPSTGDYIVNTNGQLYGMDEIDNQVYLAVATLYNSSALLNFGQQLSQLKVVSTSQKSKIDNLVNSVLSDIVIRGDITITDIITDYKKDKLNVRIKYKNNKTGRLVDTFLPGDQNPSSIKPVSALTLNAFSTFTSNTVSNCYLWWNSGNDGYVSNSGSTLFISALDDSSGNNRNLTANDGYVVFNAVDLQYGFNRWSSIGLTTGNYMSSNISLSGNWTFYAVLAFSTNSCYILYSSGGANIGADSSGKIYTGTLKTANSYTGQTIIVKVVFNGITSSLSVYANNKQSETILGDTTGLVLTSTVYLGSNASTSSINGSIAEAIIYSGYQNPIDSATVISYLKTKYNIQSL